MKKTLLTISLMLTAAIVVASPRYFFALRKSDPDQLVASFVSNGPHAENSQRIFIEVTETQFEDGFENLDPQLIEDAIDAAEDEESNFKNWDKKQKGSFAYLLSLINELRQTNGLDVVSENDAKKGIKDNMKNKDNGNGNQ